MRNRILKSVWMLAVCLPALAAAQERRSFRGADTWEFGLAGGISIMDASLRNFLASGAPESRFAKSVPSAIAPTVAVRMGYNFGPNLGFSLGGTAAFGSGVRYLTPDASITWTWNLNAKTSPYLIGGMALTRIDGINHRTTHSTWGAQGGVGFRHMITDRAALRLQGLLRYEPYQDFAKGHAVTPVITLGISYFGHGRRPVYPQAAVFLPGTNRVDTLVRARLDTAWVTRVDTVRGIVYVMEPGADQLLLRVQFETDSTIILPLSRPVLDTIAMALMADPASLWEIQGHTDNVGGLEHNQRLSEGRAQAVVDYLVSRGVNRSNLEAIGYGELRPVISNATPEGRAQNRRVQMRRRPSGAYVVPIP